MKSPLDAVIIGGGIAGAALGTLLASRGHAVEILERTDGEHDRICGEFYSGEAIQYLAALGVDLSSLGGMPVASVRLAAQEVIAECPLPFPGISLPRRAVDECLLSQAAIAGALVTRGVTVESLTSADGEWLARLRDQTERIARDAFVATGKHDLRGRGRGNGTQNDLVAFKMYLRLSGRHERELHRCIELILFAGGYAGLQFVEPGCANLSLLITKAALQHCGPEWSGVLSHAAGSSKHLAARLDDAAPLLMKPLALSSIPYGYRRPPSPGEPWYIGDQCAVIPSFTGNGMSIALHSAFAAARSYEQGLSSFSYQQEIAAQLLRPVQFSTWLSRWMTSIPSLANALRVYPGAMGWIASQTRIPCELQRAAH